ncbi:hypothetical protein STIUS_v1c00750 [Spiroplasma sp. TIUS-1]|uniref:hypothetical protein n=1 Tax=Spiroplasma sp. TIUS-1 TaxID=216963 RepID=UPI001399183D|nr:hypothetical protein [Spiroplasma sp. TIUS-1]QHX35630.1 hypothetical protein STIUS_v1c00750 [Spiroplasma sp. TIUS-1]
MKIENKKIFNLTANIFKFNMRNKKFWVFVYLLIGLAVAFILLGAFIASKVAIFDSSIVLQLMPYFNLISGICLSLLFIMFAATPLFRDKDLALYDLEKRYGYKPWEIVLSRLIWIFAMCFSAWFIVLIASLIGGSFGSMGSKVIYIKSFVIPSVWNLYLLFLVPLLTMFISLVFGALFGKMVLYFLTIIVAFSPVVSNLIATISGGIGSGSSGHNEKVYRYKGELISRLLYDKYFEELIIDIDEKDVFFDMLNEYEKLESIEGFSDKELHKGIPFIEKENHNVKPEEYKNIKEFYNLVVTDNLIPKHSLINGPSYNLSYDPSIFNSYLSKINSGYYKNTIRVLTEIFNEWSLIMSLDSDNYDSNWNNDYIYSYIESEKNMYENSIEVAVFNVSFFTVLHELSYRVGDKFKEPIIDEKLKNKTGTNAFVHILNPLTVWGMMFNAPINSSANLLLQSFDYKGKNPYSSLNYYFEMEIVNINGLDSEIAVVHKIVSPELIITLHFLLMVVLYYVGYLLWKKQILK